MDQKLGKVLFPGQKKGLIRVFIKGGQQELFAQSHFHFFEDKDDLVATKPKPRVSLIKKKAHEDSSDQLSLNLFDTNMDKVQKYIQKTIWRGLL
ncbi:hypothetical protein V7128_21900 [Neobacillus vireti]|uniref:hypothetical protein n=1 Tax=Neobacillus vireti TaxID=220686 RepID=UPI002FFF56B0